MISKTLHWPRWPWPMSATAIHLIVGRSQFAHFGLVRFLQLLHIVVPIVDHRKLLAHREVGALQRIYGT